MSQYKSYPSPTEAVLWSKTLKKDDINGINRFPKRLEDSIGKNQHKIH